MVHEMADLGQKEDPVSPDVAAFQLSRTVLTLLTQIPAAQGYPGEWRTPVSAPPQHARPERLTALSP